MGFKIVDPLNPKGISPSFWLTRESAEQSIAGWLERCDRGAREDLTREYLERLIVVEVP